ncbi:hypothetical protein [Companilactobacillus ginsenosidimutans]|nr:hypothetical protein [Companilactobacillus ginsenosidimutans]
MTYRKVIMELEENGCIDKLTTLKMELTDSIDVILSRSSTYMKVENIM